MMDQKIKSEWLKALRSGEYKQTRATMRDLGGYCCLGVLCAVQGSDFNFTDFPIGLATSYVPLKFAAGLLRCEMNRLSQMNDSFYTFEQIADHIEAAY